MEGVAMDLTMSTGLTYWGMVVGTILFGITLAQGFIYYITASDGVFLKSIVAAVLLLDTGDTLATAFAVSFYTIESWGNPNGLGVFPASLTTEFFLSILIVFIVQLYFINQIYTFDKKSLPWCIILSTFALASLVLGTIISVRAYKLQNPSFLSEPTYFDLLAALTAITTATDVIAAILLSIRIKQAQPVNFKKTDVLVKYLLTFIFSRGIMVAAVQIAYGIAYFKSPRGFVWGVLRILVAKLYGNSFLAMLNSRELIRNKASRQVLNTYASSGMPSFRYSAKATRSATESVTQNDTTSIPMTVYVGDSAIDITRDHGNVYSKREYTGDMRV